MEQSFSVKYNFAYLSSILRLLQIICTASNMVLIFLESGNLSYSYFGLYMGLCGLYLHHVLRKWLFNIDGRYDLHRLVSEGQSTASVQYAIACLSACLLSWPMWYLVRLENGTNKVLTGLFGLGSILSSHVLLFLEIYEVFGTKDKQ